MKEAPAADEVKADVCIEVIHVFEFQEGFTVDIAIECPLGPAPLGPAVGVIVELGSRTQSRLWPTVERPPEAERQIGLKAGLDST